MSSSDEIAIEIPTLIRKYRSGTIERLFPSNPVPACLDTTTGVLSKDVIINPSTGLTARLYLPPSAPSNIKKHTVLIYYHGGGFCLLSASSSIYHNFLNSLVVKANVLAVSVDYRLAPEHPIPAAYDDSWEATRWVSAGADPWLLKFGNLDKIFLAGDSAGGNIVHNMGLKVGSEGMKVEGLVLLHPYFWGKERIEEENQKVNGLKVTDVDNLWSIVCTGTVELDDPKLNPTAVGAPSLAGLGSGRVLICVAEMDLLRGRGRVYYEKLIKESDWEGEVEFFESKGEEHVFFLLNPEGAKAEEMVELLVKFFSK